VREVLAKAGPMYSKAWFSTQPRSWWLHPEGYWGLKPKAVFQKDYRAVDVLLANDYPLNTSQYLRRTTAAIALLNDDEQMLGYLFKKGATFSMWKPWLYSTPWLSKWSHHSKATVLEKQRSEFKDFSRRMGVLHTPPPAARTF